MSEYDSSLVGSDDGRRNSWTFDSDASEQELLELNRWGSKKVSL